MSLARQPRDLEEPVRLAEIDLGRLADKLVRAMPELEQAEQRLAIELYRLLAAGGPVSPERLARRAALPPGRVARLLESWPGVYFDLRGNVIGFWGLAQAAAMPPHRFEVGGQKLSTWCAWDALFLPVILGKSARVESTCATTGERISLTVGPDGVGEVSPPAAVLSFLRPGEKFDDDVILNFCHYVLFFSSEEAGSEWVSRREGAFLLTLGEGFELGRHVVERAFGAGLGGPR